MGCYEGSRRGGMGWEHSGGFPRVIATCCTPDNIALFDLHYGVSRKRAFFETPLSAFIAECGALTARRVRHITSPLSWHPASAYNKHGAKLPENPANIALS